MKITIKNKKLTESHMSSVFQEKLCSQSHFSCFPRFTIISQEVNCLQGKPDFISLTYPKIRSRDIAIFSKIGLAKNTRSLVRILSLLHHFSPRTISFLINKTGYSKRTIQQSLSILLEYSIIRRTKRDSYIISPTWDFPRNEMWAFELKLSNWKRALFQALQCKSYAVRVIIVLPKNQERIINSYKHYFKNLHIGVMLFDPYDSTYSFMVKPIVNKFFSKMHYLYAFSKMSQSLRLNK
jgi:DNA-binding transcriptional ArsR family regulator